MNESEPAHRVAVIGAGVAGLACAARLAAAGRSIRMFDKSRGPGGRMATRRVDLPDGRQVRFDHGAQYATAREDAFAEVLAGLARKGVADPYPWPIFCRADAGAGTHLTAERWAGAGGMTAIAKAMAEGLDIQFGRQLTGLARAGSSWRLRFSDGHSEDGFETVVLAIPAPQAIPLLRGQADALLSEIESTRMAPCWAGLFVFDGGGPAFGAIRLDDDDVLSWMARTGDGQGWIAHATPEWSRLNLELDPEAAMRELEAAVRAEAPDLGPTLAAQAHRWRYALVETPAGKDFLWEKSLGLALCGDWLLGPRIELAWRSGDQLGAALAGA